MNIHYDTDDRTLPVSKNNRLPVDISGGDSPSVDAFGRWRVSNPETIFDSKQIFDNGPLFWDDQEVSGSGTGSSHSANTATTTISVSANTAGLRMRQTFMRFNYQPGKSQRILLTCNNLDAGAGIVKGFGLGDDNNGLFLVSDGGTLKFVRRTKTSGSVIDNETEVTITTSGDAVDTSKTMILDIDFEWLGVGRIRAGYVNGVNVDYFFTYTGVNNLNTVYMSTPNLPIRYWIENDGNGGADSFDHICASVVSEGGSQELGVVRYASTGGTHVDANTENTIYAVLGIRLKSAYIGATVKIINTALQIHTSSEKVEWILKFKPTVAGTFTYADQTNSAVQIATGATANTVTGGIDIGGGFLESGGVQAGSAGSDSAGIASALLLGSNIAGTVDDIVLCVRPIAGSVDVDVEGSLTWRELV